MTGNWKKWAAIAGGMCAMAALMAPLSNAASAGSAGGAAVASQQNANEQRAGAPIQLALIEGMSGPFADAGAAVERNVRFAVERVNARGGVKLPDGAHPLELVVLDSQGSVEQALVQLRAAADRHIPFVLQGNGSAVAAALVSAIDKQNAREPEHRELFLNYSADDPALTGASCSFWHFRFDAHAGMRMNALADVIARDKSVKRVYLLNQDYSFGHDVSTLARAALAAKRPDIAIVGDEFHPIGRVKDFTPYIAKLRASGADAVVTGNWGNDLALLVKAAREQGFGGKFYTFYGNSLDAPAAIGEAGVGRVLAVADWHPNAGSAAAPELRLPHADASASDAYYAAFRARFPAARDDYALLRIDVMIEMLADAVARAHSADAVAVAKALEGMRYENGFTQASMRAEDHQLIQPLYVIEMDKAGAPGVRFGNEGSSYGFRTVLALPPQRTEMASECRMKRP